MTLNISCQSLLACKVSFWEISWQFYGHSFVGNWLLFSCSFKLLPLSLIFGIVIMMCRGVGLFGFILFGTLSASWTCMSTSFTTLGKFSVIIFSNRFSISCSLPPSSTPWCECWYDYSCPGDSLHYPNFFIFFFLFVGLMGCFLLSYIPNSWFDSWLHPLYCWFSVSFSSFQLVYHSFLTGSFLWSFFMLSSSALPLSSMSIL